MVTEREPEDYVPPALEQMSEEELAILDRRLEQEPFIIQDELRLLDELIDSSSRSFSSWLRQSYIDVPAKGYYGHEGGETCS